MKRQFSNERGKYLERNFIVTRFIRPSLPNVVTQALFVLKSSLFVITEYALPND